MRGDALALQKDLDGAWRQPYLDLAAGEAVGHAVEVSFDLDVVIDADAAPPPFSEGIGFARQTLEVRPIEFLEQRPAGDAEAADRSLLVELVQKLADRRVELGQAVEAAMTQPPEQPALDDQHRGLDFRLVARPARACRKDRRVVMRCQLGVGAVDLRLVEAGLDHGDFGVVRHQQVRHPADRLESPGVCADPISERLGPARLGIGEVGGAQYRDKDLRRPGLAGQPVDDHRHRVAGVIDKQLVAAGMGLPHRNRDPGGPAPVQLAEPRIAIPVGMPLDVLVPKDLQRDVLALQLAVNRRPVGLGATAVTLLLADPGKELRFQRRVGQLARQWPVQPGDREPLQCQPDGRERHADSAGDLVAGYPGGLQPKHVAHLAHRDPLCWHRPLPWQKPKERTLNGPAEAPSNRARSSRNGGRNHLGTPSNIKSEWWARSSRNPGRLPSESALSSPRPNARAPCARKSASCAAARCWSLAKSATCRSPPAAAICSSNWSTPAMKRAP